MKRSSAKRSLLCGTVAAALIGLAATASADFSGYYDPSNWTVTHVPDGTTDAGGVDASGAPGSIIVLGSNTGSGLGSRVEYTIAAQAAGNVDFDWGYGTFDLLPVFDSAGYIFGGTNRQQLTDDNGATTQGGSMSFAVSSGEIFGFYVETVDNEFGFAGLGIANFCGPGDAECSSSSVPEPASLALMALGLLGLGAVRTRRAR